MGCVARSLSFMVMGLVSSWSLAIILIQSLSRWHTHRSAKMDASERDSGKWTDTRCLLSTFPELFRLVVAYSCVFLIRISCHKTTHANGYYGAWPGWAVSISVLPLTLGTFCCKHLLWLSVSKSLLCEGMFPLWTICEVRRAPSGAASATECLPFRTHLSGLNPISVLTTQT